MQLDLEKNSGIFIRSFRPGELRIGDSTMNRPVILTPREILADWSPPAIDALSITDFGRALEADPEVILFGSGTKQTFPPTRLVTDIMRRGIGFESMDTAAACRTFNVLAAEGRRVVAALLV